ncbi:hypothetical protein [Bizionia arctica]|nr:hypothetical protein [Bizionia arctica]
MKTVKDLLSEISTLIRDIETNYPEVYKYLDENPDTIPNMDHPEISTEDLEIYLATLKDLVLKYKKNHKN